MPKGTIVGTFSDEESVKERRRQFKLYDDARAYVLQDRNAKARFPNPNNSPIHTPLDFFESLMIWKNLLMKNLRLMMNFHQ